MSYDIYIGNAEVETHAPDDYGGELAANYKVRGMTHPDAPSFARDTMTGNGNSRHPGYIQWGEFCDSTGLRALFFDEQAGIMRQHPGCFALLSVHLATVRDALDAWRRAHPDAIPGWDFSPQWHPKDDVDDGVRGRDGNLARLLWLEWWMDYALRECAVPAIYNR